MSDHSKILAELTTQLNDQLAALQQLSVNVSELQTRWVAAEMRANKLDFSGSGESTTGCPTFLVYETIHEAVNEYQNFIDGKAWRDIPIGQLATELHEAIARQLPTNLKDKSTTDDLFTELTAVFTRRAIAMQAQTNSPEETVVSWPGGLFDFYLTVMANTEIFGRLVTLGLPKLTEAEREEAIRLSEEATADLKEETSASATSETTDDSESPIDDTKLRFRTLDEEPILANLRYWAEREQMAEKVRIDLAALLTDKGKAVLEVDIKNFAQAMEIIKWGHLSSRDDNNTCSSISARLTAIHWDATIVSSDDS